MSETPSVFLIGWWKKYGIIEVPRTAVRIENGCVYLDEGEIQVVAPRHPHESLLILPRTEGERRGDATDDRPIPIGRPGYWAETFDEARDLLTARWKRRLAYLRRKMRAEEQSALHPLRASVEVRAE